MRQTKVSKPLHLNETTYHSNSSTHCFWWQVVSELRTHNTTISMRSGNFAPHHADFAWFLVTFGYSLPFCTVNKCNTFAQVEICFLLVIDTLNPDKGGVGLLIAQTSFVTKDNAFGIQAKLELN